MNMLTRIPEQTLQTRELPVNIDAEQALIGALFLNNNVFQTIGEIINEDHFSEPMHRQIWRTSQALIQKGHPADPITLKGVLGNPELAPGRTLMAYLADLTVSATGTVNARSYATMIRDMAVRRQVIFEAQAILDQAYDAPVEQTVESLFADFETRLEGCRPPVSTEARSFTDFGSVSSAAVYEAYQRGGQMVGLPTGLQKLDELLGGMQPGELTIIAGRPGSGKTALATSIAVAVARHVLARLEAGERLGWVGFNSMEMSGAQLKARVLADMAEVPYFVLRRGLANQEQMMRYEAAERDFRSLPMAVDERPALALPQVRMAARNLKKKRGLSLLVVDYLQLMKGSQRRYNSRSEEVSEISAGLKELSKELGVPVIALSQVGRDVDKRDDKRPMLADLRESGSIEQDADQVIFLYREEYYLRKTEPKHGTDAHAKWERDLQAVEGMAEANIAKNRHGSEGRAVLGFIGKFTRFTNEPEERQIQPEEYRERAKAKPRLGPDAAQLWSLLKSLTNARSKVATSEQRNRDHRLLKGARLVKVEEARAAFGAELYPEDPEDKLKTKFTNAFKQLRNADIAVYHGSEEHGYFAWLPEMVADD